MIDKIPFIAMKAGLSNLISGKLKIPAIIETTPMIIVITLGKLTELNPLVRVAKLFTFASKTKAIPIIIIRKDSM